VFTFVAGTRASLVQALSVLTGARGFFSPLPSHARWTPWSVLQDGTIEAMHLTGDLPASALPRPYHNPPFVEPIPFRWRDKLRLVPFARKRVACPPPPPNRGRLGGEERRAAPSRTKVLPLTPRREGEKAGSVCLFGCPRGSEQPLGACAMDFLGQWGLDPGLASLRKCPVRHCWRRAKAAWGNHESRTPSD